MCVSVGQCAPDRDRPRLEGAPIHSKRITQLARDESCLLRAASWPNIKLVVARSEVVPPPQCRARHVKVLSEIASRPAARMQDPRKFVVSNHKIQKSLYACGCARRWPEMGQEHEFCARSRCIMPPPPLAFVFELQPRTFVPCCLCGSRIGHQWKQWKLWPV